MLLLIRPGEYSPLLFPRVSYGRGPRAAVKGVGDGTFGKRLWHVGRTATVFVVVGGYDESPAQRCCPEPINNSADTSSRVRIIFTREYRPRPAPPLAENHNTFSENPNKW